LGPFFLGNWREEGFSFLFFSRPCDKTVHQFISEQPHLTLLDKYHMTYEQWQGGRVTAFRAGRFLISPPWEKADLSGDTIAIVLDPGVVFGTGTHPTTRDCLEALSFLAREEAIRSVADLGTGTGLLALAAAKLGSRQTLAVDVNYLAAKTAGENIRLNGLAHRVLVIQGRAEDWVHSPVDLLIANIHYDVMKDLIDTAGFYRKKWFVLSGLLRSQAGDISRKLSARPVKLIKKWEQEGIWHTFLGKIC
jgi:ribosomal protein L11 methyltransferase